VSRLGRFERVAWGLGLALIVVYGAVRVHGAIMKEHELERFAEARRAAVESRPASDGAIPVAAPGERPPIDFRLWSEGRVRAYEESLEQETDAPLAVLRIPKIRLEVPVLDGTDDFALNRAVGHIRGTARPGEVGNVGIAGHRDGFFRGLKNITRGDLIKLETLEGTETYIIDEVVIVDPDAVEVLDPTEASSITLVTCYPFYFVGSAPQRYVVRGIRSPSPMARVRGDSR
jgi:sortase A